MAVTIYKSTDPGAPALNATGTTSALANLKKVMLACLVNGYQDKPAAGWTLGHQSSNQQGFSLFNGDGYVNFVHDVATVHFATIYVMDSLTAGTTSALAAGVNRRSKTWGTGSTSTTERQWTGLHSLSEDYMPYYPGFWVMVADAKTAYFYASLDMSQGAGGGAVDASYTTLFGFGKYHNGLGLTGPASFGSFGGAPQAHTACALGPPYDFCGTLLRNPFTGLAAQGATPHASAMGFSYQNANRVFTTYSELRPSRLSLGPTAVYCYGQGLNAQTDSSYASPCGYLRGVFNDATLSSLNHFGLYKALGLPAPLFSSVYTPVTLPGGKQVLPLYSVGNDCLYLLSLDAADWG